MSINILNVSTSFYASRAPSLKTPFVSNKSVHPKIFRPFLGQNETKKHTYTSITQTFFSESTSIHKVIQKSEFCKDRALNLNLSKCGAKAAQLEQVVRCKGVQRLECGRSKTRLLNHDVYKLNSIKRTIYTKPDALLDQFRVKFSNLQCRVLDSALPHEHFSFFKKLNDETKQDILLKAASNFDLMKLVGDTYFAKRSDTVCKELESILFQSIDMRSSLVNYALEEGISFPKVAIPGIIRNSEVIKIDESNKLEKLLLEHPSNTQCHQFLITLIKKEKLQSILDEPDKFGHFLHFKLCYKLHEFDEGKNFLKEMNIFQKASPKEIAANARLSAEVTEATGGFYW